jgi:GTPase SAR1 family protein
VDVIIVVGMAGCGKSYLVSGLYNWLRMKELNVITVNFDPGAVALPYNPTVDCRVFVDTRRLMEEYQLGPNGALVMAADLIADHMEEVRQNIEDETADIVLADTPGLLELFAFRESGPYISRGIPGEGKAVVYAFDGVFSKSPANYVSNMFMAAAVYNRLLQPQVYAITKADLLSEQELDQMVAWSEDLEELEQSLETQLGKTASLINRDLARAISQVGLVSEPIPVSAKTFDGFIELYAALTRIFAGGEEPLP